MDRQTLIKDKVAELQKRMDAEDSGWRTLDNDVHIHFGDDGTVDKGPAALKGNKLVSKHKKVSDKEKNKGASKYSKPDKHKSVFEQIPEVEKKKPKGTIKWVKPDNYGPEFGKDDYQYMHPEKPKFFYKDPEKKSDDASEAKKIFDMPRDEIESIQDANSYTLSSKDEYVKDYNDFKIRDAYEKLQYAEDTVSDYDYYSSGAYGETGGSLPKNFVGPEKRRQELTKDIKDIPVGTYIYAREKFKDSKYADSEEGFTVIKGDDGKFRGVTKNFPSHMKQKDLYDENDVTAMIEECPFNIVVFRKNDKKKK